MARQKGTDNQPLRMCCLTYKKQWLKLTVTSLPSSSVNNKSYSFFFFSFCHVPCLVSAASTGWSASVLLPDTDKTVGLIDVILLLLTKRKRERERDNICIPAFAAFSENTINRVWSVIVKLP